MVKKNDKSRRILKNLIAGLIPLLLAFFFLAVALVWGNRQEWVWFGFYFGASIITAVFLTGFLIFCTIREASDRLEKILKDIRDSLEKQNKGESTKKDTRNPLP